MKKKNKILAPFEVMVCIVDRGKGEKVLDTLKMNGCNKNLLTLGTGTAAKSSTGDFFGFGVIEREIIFSFIDKLKVEQITNILTDYLNLNEPHTGILLTLPIASAASNLLDMMGINY